ncbi:fatty acid desaturase [Nonomuraea antimicrobica]|uniref:fatty acid desaturase n=1 Tax=Nonomuraea antimicrobica TaxID=561173 RepID=UPI0031EA4F7A
MTVGFHRLLTHSSFTGRPWLRMTLAVAGSMSFQGNVIDWVAVHRRHHAFTDRPGDPHSPYRYGTGLRGQLRGLAHAHLGRLLADDPPPGRALRSEPATDPMQPSMHRQRSSAMGIIAWITLGLVAGWVARMLVPGKDPQGLIITFVLGIAGALLGGLVATQVFHLSGIQGFFDLSTWLCAIVGAAVLLFGHNLIIGRRSDDRAGRR